MTLCLPVGLLGIGSAELLIVLAVAMILLGPKELPKIARSVGKFMAHLRSVSDDFQNQVMHIGDEVASPVTEEKPAEPVQDTSVAEGAPAGTGSSSPELDNPGASPMTDGAAPLEPAAEANPATQFNGDGLAAAETIPPGQNKDTPNEPAG